ncbi:MAG: hypothetical protein HN975_00725 [Anaerolineae bacterium]|jgi:hypothetical protein|nr:hypothetical protein [Anaerolineae bacterium]
MDKEREIAKRYVKVKLKEQKSDFEYWQSQPPAKRLAALEEIRMQYHGWTYETYPRLKRVLSIIKR